MAAAASPAFPAYGAAPDNDVEWNGISHVASCDRRPLCPVFNEAFEVRFQAYTNDLTSARVFLDEEGATSWIDASRSGSRGAYDIWTAQIPATSSALVEYYIELTDGTDTDYLGAGGVSDLPPSSGWVMDFPTLSHAPVGATVATGGTVFRVWAPGASTCYVRGDFNGWGLDDPMPKVGEHFIIYVAGAQRGHEYKYFFGPGDIWRPDARSRAFNSGSFMNSIIEDPLDYPWQVEDFEVPPLEEMVVYQLHIGTFAGLNDPYGDAAFPAGYTEVAERAAHLVDLGVNAVMINPVTEFPGDLSGGYNPVTAYAPEWVYGTPDELRNMVDVLHQNGIAVILDIVWNHFSFSDNFLWYYDGTQIYFDDPAVETPWGSQADFDSGEVRDYFTGSVHHWMEEYRIDGFRMDATSFMNIQPGGWSLMQEMNGILDGRYAGRVAIAEQLPDDSWVTRPASLGGAGFDCQYYDWFTDSLREEIFDASFGDPEMWKIRDIINGSGQYLQGSSVFNYFELHDEAWPTSGGQRAVKTIDNTAPHDDIYARGRTKLAHGIVILAPGVPAFLMGCEWLEDNDFGTDPGNRIDWSHKTEYDEYFAYFRDLLDLRGEPAFRSDASIYVHHVNEGGNVTGFRRWNGDNDFVVVANFSNTDYAGYRIGVAQDIYMIEAINSQDPIYDGSGPVNPGKILPEPVSLDGYAQSVVIDLPAMALIVLQTGSPQTGDADAVPPAPDMLEQNYPNPFNPATVIGFSLSRGADTRLEIFDVSGRLVRTLVDEALHSGRHEAVWDGTNDRGVKAASGIYFYRLTLPGYEKTRKMLLVR